jgi:phospholipid-binding lipoprotein MlaA
LSLPSTFRASRSAFLIVFGALALSACTTYQDPAQRTDGINDPYEAQNRAIHGFNKGLDRSLVRPISKGYAVIPVDLRDRVNDFSTNLSLPGVAINSLLQADLRGAGIATSRFVINTTLGFAGFFDPSTSMSIPDHSTDFGQTLAVWGVGEGAYIEMPIFGPSTQRDAVGFVTDFFTNPLTFWTIDTSPEQYIPPTARGAAWLNDREKFAGEIDSVLYESADSYALARSIYLQNRRFELGTTGTGGEDAYLDPYASVIDPYDE